MANDDETKTIAMMSFYNGKPIANEVLLKDFINAYEKSDRLLAAIY